MVTPAPCRSQTSSRRLAVLLLVSPLFVGLGPSASHGQLRYPFLPAMETVPDARSAGMGRAFTAVAEGPSAVWWNPGALGLPLPWSAQLVTNLNRVTWIGSKELDVYAVAGRIRGAGVACHVLRLGEDAGSRVTRRKSDALVHVGGGIDLARRTGLGSSERVRWGMGVAAKYYTISLSDEPIDRGYRTRASALDVDLGSLLALRVPLVRGAGGDLFGLRGATVPYAGLRAAAVLRNAFNREIDLTKSKGGEGPLGQQIRAGFALEAGSAAWHAFGPVVAGTISAEMTGDVDNARSSPARCFGVELAILRVLSLRYGEIRDEEWKFRGVSRGLGLCLGLPSRAGVRLDWAHVPYPRGLYRPEMPAADAEQFSGSIWLQP